MSGRRNVSPTDTPTTLTIPERPLSVPSYLSTEAQAFLAAGPMAGPAWPDVDDHEGWRLQIAETAAMVEPVFEMRTAAIAASVRETDVDGVPVYAITPDGIADDSHVLLEVHGGALVSGSGTQCVAMGKFAAERAGALTWAVDYRLPPDHPYPTPVDDCLTVYRALIASRGPENVIVCGESAGANIAASMILRARDEGLPLPNAALLMTPELDLTESGDTFQTLMGVDNVMTHSLMPANLLYANGHDLAHPYLSPLFADLTLGFPPTLLSAGTRDIFLSNAVRMHRALRACDVEAELHIVDCAPHGGFFGLAPEDRELDREVRHYVDARWQR
jgi:acetyl esterase/lipase